MSAGAENPIRRLRQIAGVTQQEAARRATTSQATIAAYESGRKSPTLRTLANLARALGLEPSIDFVPALTREDRRSLAYHRAVAEVLASDPEAIARARRWLAQHRGKHPHARALFDLWGEWLMLPLEELLSKILSTSEIARSMRQVSPFAGTLSAAERRRVLEKFRVAEST